MLNRISTSFFASPKGEDWVRPCTDPRTTGTPVFVYVVDAGATYGTVTGRGCVPDGQQHGVTLRIFSGQSCAKGPGWTYS